MKVVPLRKSTAANLWRGRRKPALPLDLPPIEVKSADGWRFQWHRAVLERRDLTRSEIAVAGILMHAYRVERHHAEIAIATLAKTLGCSRRTVISAVHRLRDLGLIAVANAGERIHGRPTMATHRYRLIYLDRGVM
jgi:hypothetical protein